MFFTAHQRVQGDERLSNHTRQCVVQLCSLDGKVIADPHMRISYVTWVMEALLAHLDMLMSTGQAMDPAEAYSVSESINRLVTVCTSRSDTNVYTVLPAQLSALMHKMALLSCYCLRQMPIEEDQTWFAESFDQLLEAWGSFAGDERCPAGAGNVHVTSIFETYLQSRLKAEEASVAEDGDDEVFEEEDDQSMYDDQLVGVATIVRWCPHGTLGLLRQTLTSLIMQIHGKDPQQIMHVYGGIHWLLLVAGHVLADSASGEKPMVPVELNTLSAAFTQAGQEDPVVEIIDAVFRYMDYENNLIGQKLHGHLSPLVAKTLAWFLGRWAQTYLMPEPSDCLLIAPCLHNNYGRQTPGGQAVLERVLQKIYINLSSWGFEHELAKETVGVLLTLSKNQHVRAAIHQSPTWLALCKGFVQESMPLGSSPTEVLRELAHGCIAISDGNKDAFMHCIADILTPVGHLFESIVHAPGFSRHAQEGRVMAQIERILDICCGVVQGAASTNSPILFDFIQQHAEGFLSLTHIYANCPEHVLAVVELYALQAEFMLAYLSDAHAAVLYDHCLRLLKLYSQHNLGKTRRGELGEEEQYEDLLLFLRLLTHLLSRDFLDFSDTGNMSAEVRVLPLPNTVQVADVVLYGLTMILPLMTEKLLQFPALCTQYFKLVSFLCEIYPEKVAHLDPALLQAVSYSMRLGLTAYGSKIAESALDGIAALAQYSAEEAQKGSQIPEAFSSTLGMYLTVLFESALVEDYDTTVTAHTAEALFPLIYSRQGEFQALAQQLVASQSDPTLQQRSMEAIQLLLTANGLQLGPGRKNLTVFTKNFQAFLGNVRGFLRKR